MASKTETAGKAPASASVKTAEQPAASMADDTLLGDDLIDVDTGEAEGGGVAGEAPPVAAPPPPMDLMGDLLSLDLATADCRLSQLVAGRPCVYL